MLTEQEVEMNNELNEDVFDTPTIEVPATEPEVHRGVVTGVSVRRLNNEKQTAILSIGLVSKDVPTLEKSLDIFIPKGYEEGIGDSSFDVSSLPEEQGNKQQTSYRMGIANSEKTAALQRYVFNRAGTYQNSKGKDVLVADSIARKAGRNPIELGLKKATTLDELAENVGKMLQGVDVLFTLKERGVDDPAFSHQLNVKDIFSADEYELNPKKFKSFRPAWEQ